MTDASQTDAQSTFSGTREVDPRPALDVAALDVWMAAKVDGTSTVAPKATYLRRSQAGQAAKLSAEAPESQKNTRSIRSMKVIEIQAEYVRKAGGVA